jgi:hypothetical protein
MLLRAQRRHTRFKEERSCFTLQCFSRCCDAAKLLGLQESAILLAIRHYMAVPSNQIWASRVMVALHCVKETTI